VEELASTFNPWNRFDEEVEPGADYAGIPVNVEDRKFVGAEA
jgi:hypothetical protein